MKSSLLRIGSRIAFHLGGLALIRRLAAGWRARRDSTGALVPPFVRRRASGRVQILTYHRVNDENDPFFPATRVRTFAAQMEQVAAASRVCGLDDAVEMLRRREVVDDVVVVTFDDGYRDNYIHAYPILKSMGIPATIFLATQAIDSGRVLWHDRVFSAFRHARAPRLRSLERNGTSYPLRTVGERLVAQTEVLKQLRRVGEIERSAWIERLTDELEPEGSHDGEELMLTWDQIRAMQAGGIAFGSHTVTHPILTQLPADRVRDEIFRSKRTIEKELGADISTFAYPNGGRADFDALTKDLVREAGYRCAVSTIFGVNEAEHDLYELRRGRPWEDDIAVFATKLWWYRFSG